MWMGVPVRFAPPQDEEMTLREVWIDQNADKARLIASGWWPAQGDEGRDDDRDEPRGGEG